MKLMAKYCLLAVCLILFFSSCVNNKRKHIALKKSEEIIRRLDSDSVYTYFSRKYFRREEIENLTRTIGSKCDYNSRKVEFIDDFYEKALGPKLDNVSFVYDVFMKCDSIRIILKFELDKDPRVVGFKIDSKRRLGAHDN